MKRKKVLLLINLSAGVGSAKTKMTSIVTELARRGCEVTVYPIIPEIGLTSERIIADTVGRFDVIACCGGDGTLNHVINGMLNNHVTAPIGYIPSGSTNDFSRNINGDRTLEELCKVIAGDDLFMYDVGKLQDRYFNYVAGFGAFTKVSYSTDQNWKNLLGYGAYVLNSIATLPENLSQDIGAVITHDGITEKGEYIFCGVTNSTSIGGMQTKLLDKAQLNDGKFEVILIRKPNNLIELNGIIQGLTSGNTKNTYVTSFQTSSITFHTNQPVSWTVDGEFGGTYTDAHIDIVPSAINICV